MIRLRERNNMMKDLNLNAQIEIRKNVSEKSDLLKNHTRKYSK